MRHEIHGRHETHEKMFFEEESYLIRGAVFEVYKEMGCGFLEAVYHECLTNEFITSKVPFESQQSITIFYKGKPIEQKCIPDFICYDKIIVELKATQTIIPAQKAQVLNYLKVTGFKLGLLINFGSYPKAEIARIIN